ncbi:MAG: fibronectin type III domain-containing protein [Treponema sp.]|jgi:fibronectin type 3 domain-containing protein|nr:fibronectin type III domain-containing protein [Treponema sp.]
MNTQTVWPAWARLFLVALAMITIACEVPTDGKFETKIIGVQQKGALPAPKVETISSVIKLTWDTPEKDTYQYIFRSKKQDDGTWGDWAWLGEICTEGEAFPISQETSTCTFYDYFAETGKIYKYAIDGGHYDYEARDWVKATGEDSAPIGGVAPDNPVAEGSSVVTYDSTTGYLTFNPSLQGPKPNARAGTPKVFLEFDDGNSTFGYLSDAPLSVVDLTAVPFPTAWFHKDMSLKVSYTPVYEETISTSRVHVICVPDSDYELTGTLIDEEGWITGIVIPAGGSTEPPAMPESVRASDIRDTQITLAWNQVVGASGYNVYRADSSNETYTKIKEGLTVREYIDTGLSPSIEYKYQVSAYNSAGETKSLSVNVTTAAVGQTRLSAPANLRVTSATPSSITLTWDPVSGGTEYYKIYRDDLSGAGLLNTTSATSYTDNTVSANTSYTYEVSAYAKNEEGAAASIQGQTPTSAEGTAPATAPTVSAEALSDDGSIKVTWTSVPGATGYIIYFSMTESGQYTAQTPVWTSATETWYTDTDVQPGQTWYYKVCAYNAAGNGPLSEPAAFATAVTPTAQLTAPTGISAVAQSDGSIRVSWNPVSGALGYRIRFAESADGDFYEWGSASTTDTWYIDTDVYVGDTWYYKVSAYNGTAQSPLSSEYAYATSAVAPVSVPDYPQLSYKTNKYDSLSAGQTVYYYFEVVSPGSYTVWWYDSDNAQNSSSYADIKVGVKYWNTTGYLAPVSDMNGTNLHSFTADHTGYIVVEVQGYSSSSSGQFAVQYW